MKARNGLLGIAAVCCAALSLAIEASAQDPGFPETSRIELSDHFTMGSGLTSPSDMRRSAPTAMEIRQERALYQMNQRMLRIEANAWMGYSPLRPNISGMASWTNYVPPHRVYYVPYYIR